MPSITLKGIPEDLLERLRAAAAHERRSLVQQALVLIEGGLDRRESLEERAARQVAAWRALAGAWKSNRSQKAELSEIYAARTMGRDVDL
jgi:hypothetical protein